MDSLPFSDCTVEKPACSETVNFFLSFPNKICSCFCIVLWSWSFCCLQTPEITIHGKDQLIAQMESEWFLTLSTINNKHFTVCITQALDKWNGQCFHNFWPYQEGSTDITILGGYITQAYCVGGTENVHSHHSMV